MPINLSQDALQRGTYLHERDVPTGLVAQFESLDTIRQLVADRDDVDPWLKALEAQIGMRSSTIAEGQTPAWADFLSILAEPAEVASENTLDDATKLYLAQEVYAAPFRWAAARMARHITNRFGSYCDPNATAIIGPLISRYVRTLRDQARFVLHLSYNRFAGSYSKWAAQATCEWPVIAEEFPLLLRQLAEIDRQTRQALDELFTRLRRDRLAIASRFGISVDQMLTAIEPGLSDRHHDGRTVMRLVFTAGTSLIYKPKPMGIEQAFNKFFADWRHVTGIDTVAIVDSGDYGWAEDVETDAPSLGDDLAPQTGHATALLWMLNATDLHLENVRRGARGMRVLDLETLLFAPVLDMPAMYDRLWRRHSINSTMLFNGSLGTGRGGHLAGFAKRARVPRNEPQSGFELQGDAVVVTAEPTRSSSRDTHDAHFMPSSTAKIVAAFSTAACGTARALAEGFVDALSDDCPLRFIARETDFYYQLLDRMRQPRFLRNAALLELDLLQLHLGVPQASGSAKQMHSVVADERRQLLRGDIPYFAYTAGGTGIMTSLGIVPGVFQCSGKDHARRKIAEFETSDVNEQAALLSIALRDASALKPFRLSYRSLSGADGAATPDLFLANAVREVAEEIVATAFRPTESPARWLTLAGGVAPENLKAEGGESTLFSGTWGVLVGLQGMERAISANVDAQFLSSFLDEQAVRWTRVLEEKASTNSNARPGQLGLAAIGGDLFAFSMLARLSDRWRFLIGHIETIVAKAHAAVAFDRSFDVISGSAGLILACEEVARLAPSSALADSVARLEQDAVERLINMARYGKDGASWIIPGQLQPLLGFAHGWAGIVAALASAYTRTDNRAHRHAIHVILRRAAAYPLSLFERDGCWQDLRMGAENQPLNGSWCNGKPGFVRGMLAVKDQWPPHVAVEVEAMIEEMRETNDELSFRFCCGTMGVVDFLIDYAACSNQTDLLIAAHKHASSVLRKLPKINPAATVELIPDICFPGLFQGLAGVGYTAARLIAPELTSLSGAMRVNTTLQNVA